MIAHAAVSHLWTFDHKLFLYHIAQQIAPA
jgi:hypothetical protein